MCPLTAWMVGQMGSGRFWESPDCRGWRRQRGVCGEVEMVGQQAPAEGCPSGRNPATCWQLEFTAAALIP